VVDIDRWFVVCIVACGTAAARRKDGRDGANGGGAAQTATEYESHGTPGPRPAQPHSEFHAREPLATLVS